MKTHRERIDYWFEQLWAKRNRGVIDEMVDPDCKIHALPGAKHGPDGFKPFYDLLTAAFTKIDIRVADSVENGDKIFFRCDATLTGKDGKVHQITGGGMVRFKGERYIEGWNQWDFLSLMTSMGDLSPTALLDSVGALAKS